MSREELVKAFRELATGRGLADPERLASASAALEAMRVDPQESNASVLSRRVDALRDVNEIKRRIYLAGALGGDVTPRRANRLLPLWQELGRRPLGPRQINRHVTAVAEALVDRFLGGASTVQHYTDEIEVHIDIPAAGMVAQKIAELFVISPRGSSMSYWRGSRTIDDKDAPEYSHVGDGVFSQHADGTGGAIRLRLDFDPPATAAQKFVIVADYSLLGQVSTEKSWYAQGFRDRPVARFELTLRFAEPPTAIYWVEAYMRGDFPMHPDYAKEVSLTPTSAGGAVAHIKETEGLRDKFAGVVWFWVSPEKLGFRLPGH